MTWFRNLPYPTRLALMAATALLLISGVGLWWTYIITPKIPVWATGGSAIRWSIDQLPLKVFCDEQQDSCRQAVRLWQGSSCDELLVFTEDPLADILILIGDANDPRRGDDVEQTYASKTGDAVNHVMVYIYDPMRAPYPIRAHALGHALGLAHTSYGITKPVHRVNQLGESIEPPPMVLAKHMRALRKRYCP